MAGGLALRTPAGTALYLRCFPYDSWRMAPHLRALEEHAARLGLPAPEVFLDNGVSSRAVRPQLRQLLARAAVGQVGTLLVPGRWVFSLDDRTADAVTDFLRAAGTAIIELPDRGRTTGLPAPQALPDPQALPTPRAGAAPLLVQ
ncbi:recombinase family protein [Kitasatospora mediocidica]|uniref:recombinase family protein n=1 Tax=Kitasatospora mediocidica TaxID=58352 RepID=UPI00055D1045|nr:recombinase family protein [Kitasatospora mediocidica]